jgi:hypothetical protein
MHLSLLMSLVKTFSTGWHDFRRNSFRIDAKKAIESDPDM